MKPRATAVHALYALGDAITQVSDFSLPADASLYRFFRSRRELGARDRAFVSDGVFAYLRKRRSLQAQAGTAAPAKLALAVAVRELGYGLRELEPQLSDEDLEWARAFKTREPELTPAEAAELPDWLWSKLGETMEDPERAALARGWLAPAPLDLRINPLLIDRERAIAELAATGVDATPTPLSPLGLRVRGRPALGEHALVTRGALEVQDEGSQIVAYAVAPRRHEMVVDFCAGAGGKTLLLGALMRSQGRLYAFDVSRERLIKMKPRLARAGLSNVEPVRIENERDPRVKRLAGKIDRVLVDAPCSGFGTLRRNPDLKWRYGPQDIAELTVKQARILASAATLVKRGGRLVYATCSALPDENEGIVAAFLSTMSDFALVDVREELTRAGIAIDTGPYLRLTPHQHGCDGFFAAVLERRG